MSATPNPSLSTPRPYPNDGVPSAAGYYWWTHPKGEPRELCQVVEDSGMMVAKFFDGRRAYGNVGGGSYAPAKVQGMDGPAVVSIPPVELLRMVRNVVSGPFPQICVHTVASGLLSLLEDSGYPLSDDLANAVVRADDATAVRLLDAAIRAEPS